MKERRVRCPACGLEDEVMECGPHQHCGRCNLAFQETRPQLTLVKRASNE